MIEKISPEVVIFYGSVPEDCKTHIIKIKSFQEKFKEVKTDGWQR